MKILYIFGNGFDLNLGLKTSYKDFYTYYCNSLSRSNSITDLKKNISKDYETWADLELGLGEYTSKINSVSEFYEVIFDIREHLAYYLGSIENKFSMALIDQEQFLKCLTHPEIFLPKLDFEKVIKFEEKWYDIGWELNIITLNYTKIIEKILGDFKKGDKIGTHHNSNIILKSLYHIHGYVNNRMIFGVNDLNQIGNKSFHDQENLTDAFVKNNSNLASKQGINTTCHNLIKASNVICIFGCSRGKTDSLWWEYICDRLKKDCILIIFEKGDEINPRDIFLQKAIERQIIDSFLESTNLSVEEKATIKEKIIVCINSKIFNIKKKEENIQKIVTKSSSALN